MVIMIKKVFDMIYCRNRIMALIFTNIDSAFSFLLDSLCHFYAKCLFTFSLCREGCKNIKIIKSMSKKYMPSVLFRTWTHCWRGSRGFRRFFEVIQIKKNNFLVILENFGYLSFQAHGLKSEPFFSDFKPMGLNAGIG